MDTARETRSATRREVRFPAGRVELDGELTVPADAKGIVVFAHGSGSSRFSPHNQFVAAHIRDAHFGTLVFDLLTPGEEAVDVRTGHLRVDITLLSRRLTMAVQWLALQPEAAGLQFGLFGASTGAAAALVAAAVLGDDVGAVVSRGGRPDLAGSALPLVACPTLLVVGGRDETVLELNRFAFEDLRCEKELAVVPGATHLFEEPGALEAVARLAAAWFDRHHAPRD